MKEQAARSLINLLAEDGGESYFGEPVSVLEHSLQTAHFAKESGAAPATIVAALLHDVGHLLHGLPEDIAQHSQDGMHEEIAAAYLAEWFPEDVTEPIRLHVASKRYLCAVDRGYLALLSPSSIESLRLQGGPMNSNEIASFEKEAHASVAVQLRRWDDRAKIQGFSVSGLQDYFPLLITAMRR